LREEGGATTTKVLITNLDEKQLSDDILVRLAKRKLFPIDSWQIVRSLFQAHAIDPRLTRHRWIADHLMEFIPKGDIRRSPEAFWTLRWSGLFCSGGSSDSLATGQIWPRFSSGPSTQLQSRVF